MHSVTIARFLGSAKPRNLRKLLRTIPPNLKAGAENYSSESEKAGAAENYVFRGI